MSKLQDLIEWMEGIVLPIPTSTTVTYSDAERLKRMIVGKAKSLQSESRIYLEKEVFGFASWYKVMDGWEYLENKTMKEVFEIYIKTFQPKTEEVSPIVIEESPLENKEQPTSPSIEFRNQLNDYGKEVYDKGFRDGFIKGSEAENIYSDEINPIPSIEKMAEEWAKKSFQPLPNATGQPRQTPVGQNPHGWKKHLNISKRSFIEGYKANNSLEELEKWVKGEIQNIRKDESKLFSEIERNTEPYFQVIDKIQELKTKQ